MLQASGLGGGGEIKIKINSIPTKTMTTSIKLTTLTNSDEVHRIEGSLKLPH